MLWVFILIWIGINIYWIKNIHSGKSNLTFL